jgi:hypothetical protein
VQLDDLMRGCLKLGDLRDSRSKLGDLWHVMAWDVAPDTEDNTDA